jgi:hypothetical protein
MWEYITYGWGEFLLHIFKRHVGKLLLTLSLSFGTANEMHCLIFEQDADLHAQIRTSYGYMGACGVRLPMWGPVRQS